MKVLSISDVITNSSSEVFVIHSKPEFQDEINREIPELLTSICELVGLDIDEVMEFDVSDKSEINADWSYHVAKNDLVIYSCGDNSIPYWLMEFIESLYYEPKFRDKFQGFYAEDLGEKNIPYYDWNAPYDERHKIKSQKINSIQRRHLG